MRYIINTESKWPSLLGKVKKIMKDLLSIPADAFSLIWELRNTTKDLKATVVRCLWGNWFTEPYVKPYTPVTTSLYFIVYPDKKVLLIDPLKRIKKYL